MSTGVRAGWGARFLLVIAGCAVALAILELLLNLYSPFGFRIKGDRIVPPVNAEYNVHNVDIDGLDTNIHHTKNSLGFRGPEPPADFDKDLTIVAIGGSTTECFILSDGKDWPTLLGRRLAGQFNSVWVNNAGLDGNSTYGHIILVQDYVRQLRPKVALFLVGRNELNNLEGQPLDYRFLRRPRSVGSPHEAVRFAAGYSEVVSTAYNLLYRYLKARRYDLLHATPTVTASGRIPLIDVPIQKRGSAAVSQGETERVLAGHAPALAAYRERLTQLIAVTRQSNIYPVFITQPLLFGPAIDEDTGVDLAAVLEGTSSNGALEWEVLERYNQVLRDVSARDGVDVIDLAHQMPKRSLYYYDAAHYTNAGSERVAEILAPEVAKILARQFNSYRRDVSVLTIENSRR